MLRRFLAFSFLFTCLSATAATTPEQVVTRYLHALADSSFNDIGKYFHPDSVAEFRARTEPLILRAVRTRTGRQMFGAFIDPYDPRKLRDLSHTEFMSAYLRWMNTWQSDAISVYRAATFTTLGHVSEEVENHVVVRMSADLRRVQLETLIVRSTRDFEGDQLLIVPNELVTAAEMLHQLR